MRADFLVITADHRVCALPLCAVSEVMRPLPIEPFAGTPPFVVGASIVRGRATPIVDLAALLSSARSLARRLVTLRVDDGARVIGLLVDDVLGIRHLAIDETPALLRDVDDARVLALGRLDDALVRALELGRTVPEGVWDRLASQAGRE
jgi:purine-binding chemotaxis protein CheW